MNKIKGPITFSKGKEVPVKMKNWINKNGIVLGVGESGFSYSNESMDSWMVWKESGTKKDKKKFYYDRKDGTDKEKNIKE